MKISIKHIIFSTLTYFAVLYLAFMDFLNINMYVQQETFIMELLSILVFIVFLISFFLRTFKQNTITTIIIIFSDLVLIILTFDFIITGNLLETLKNIVIEPGITLGVLGISLLIFDWTKK